MEFYDLDVFKPNSCFYIIRCHEHRIDFPMIKPFRFRVNRWSPVNMNELNRNSHPKISSSFLLVRFRKKCQKKSFFTKKENFPILERIAIWYIVCITKELTFYLFPLISRFLTQVSLSVILMIIHEKSRLHNLYMHFTLNLFHSKMARVPVILLLDKNQDNNLESRNEFFKFWQV